MVNLWIAQIPDPFNTNDGGFSANAGVSVSEAVSTALETVWQQALTGTLYQTINNVGVLIAVFCIGFWCFNLYRQMEEGGLRPAATELIFPILVIVMLSNGGANLSQFTLGMKNLINNVNQDVIQSVGTGVDLQRSLSTLANYSSAQTLISKLRAQCDGITNNEKLQQCLQENKEIAEAALQRYRANSEPRGNLFSDLQRNIQELFNDPAGAIGNAAAGSFRTALSPIMMAIEAVMVAFQGAFQYAIEVSMILTALMGPIAVGASFLPIGAKPIYAWLTAFWSLGICKMSLNVITGLVATAVIQAGTANDTLGNAIAIGLLSPILALGLSAGGGMAIFNGILAAASFISSTGVNLGVSLYTTPTIPAQSPPPSSGNPTA